MLCLKMLWTTSKSKVQNSWILNNEIFKLVARVDCYLRVLTQAWVQWKQVLTNYRFQPRSRESGRTADLFNSGRGIKWRYGRQSEWADPYFIAGFQISASSGSAALVTILKNRLPRPDDGRQLIPRVCLSDNFVTEIRVGEPIDLSDPVSLHRAGQTNQRVSLRQLHLTLKNHELMSLLWMVLINLLY